MKLNDEENRDKEKEKLKEEKKGEEDSEDEEDEYSDEEGKKEEKEKVGEKDKGADSRKKNELESKMEEWNKIIIRIPHFGQKILTIDQIIVHNMRRKEMIEASEFAWRTLRDILVMISK